MAHKGTPRLCRTLLFVQRIPLLGWGLHCTAIYVHCHVRAVYTTPGQGPHCAVTRGAAGSVGGTLIDDTNHPHTFQVGGSIALRLEELQGLVPELMPLWDRVGRPRVLAASGPVIAVGTALGAVVVFQAPSSSSMSVTAGPGAAPQQGVSGEHGGGVGEPVPTPAPPPPLVLGEARGEAEVVTALGFSTVLSGAGGGGGGAVSSSPGLWLLVGHASGTIAAWDLQRRPARQVVSIGEYDTCPQLRPYMLLGGVITFVGARTHTPCACYTLLFSLLLSSHNAYTVGQHSLPITHVSFFPGRGASSAISVDRRGRVVSHSFSSLLLRTR